MSESNEWAFPKDLQPRQSDVRFDLDPVFDAMVAIRAEIPDDAFTAGTLGTDRGGNGVVIRGDGIILTIGYLITEASSIWITTNQGAVVAGYPLAYDQPSGFGLIKALGPLKATPLARGSAARVKRGDRVFMIGHGGRRHSLQAKLSDKREFAGYWEYLLDEALFTAPAHPEWSGSAVVDEDGLLVGVGSLLVQEGVEGRTEQGNMSVPIDLLEPILDQLLATGRSGEAVRPWLGLYAGESDEQLMVGGVAAGGPAEKAGIRQGDTVLAVAGQRVVSLGEFLRAVWRLGPAGTRIPLSIARQGDVLRIEIISADRNELLKGPRLH